ncbi:UNKNOWN [Stylonychia lemnae]|uniref:VCBS repeat-containing protein n=1 Tax=Stylonychia lemnae TaxID=5949 RepID=A0A078B5Y3_STYLE|nr:UNKNOWN [Stylonychia lemnae]|eukprot:CDW89829.1 UNKNOWN [Stylonychia lemnae]
MRTISLAVLGMLLTSSVQSTNIGYKQLGQFSHPSPAFVKVAKFPGQKDSLLISEFSVFGKGKVAVISDIGDKIQSGNFADIHSSVLSDKFTWPNNVDVVPAEVFGQDVNAVVVPDGFLVPFHSNGEIYVITTNTSNVEQAEQVYQLTTQKSGYFYHTGKWVDLNGDGRLDFVTARSNAKANQGELIWLEHPEQGLQQTPWTEHLITSGPDVIFELHELPQYPNSYIIFSAEFFSHKLQVYQISKNGGEVINKALIDGTLDQVYSVQLLDINNDGKQELLVNNHETDSSKAGVFVFNVPQDLFNSNFTRKTIATGFKNAFSFTVPNMCPGFPYAVYPQTNNKHGRPHILIAGDGDYSAHLLTPTTDDTMYQMSLIKNLGGTVGSITFGDSNNNGWLEFYVPNYDKGYIEVYEFYEITESSGFLTE